ncbi:hypothetical protein D3C81_2014680 [compost metagenome]
MSFERLVLTEVNFPVIHYSEAADICFVQLVSSGGQQAKAGKHGNCGVPDTVGEQLEDHHN